MVIWRLEFFILFDIEASNFTGLNCFLLPSVICQPILKFCLLNVKVWAGSLTEKRVAVILLNRGFSSATITAKWNDIGLNSSTVVDARDLWAVCKATISSFFAENFDFFDVHVLKLISKLSDSCSIQLCTLSKIKLRQLLNPMHASFMSSHHSRMWLNNDQQQQWSLEVGFFLDVIYHLQSVMNCESHACESW